MKMSTRRQDPSEAYAAPSHVEGKDISTLPRIFEDDINIAIMHRLLPQAIQVGVTAQLQANGALSVIWLGPPGDDLRRELIKRLHNPEASGALIEDIVTLAEAMAYLFDTNTVELRLRRLENAMCPRFHYDKLPVRLVTTSHGPGSEWLPEWALNRQGLGAPNPEKPEIITAPTAIQHLAAGDLALIKGGGWIGNEEHGYTEAQACQQASSAYC